METILNITSLKEAKETNIHIDNSISSSKDMVVTQQFVNNEGKQKNVSFTLDTEEKQLRINHDILLNKREIEILIEFLSQES